MRRRLGTRHVPTVLTAIFVYVVLQPMLLSATHDGFHRYSQGDENSGAGFTGLKSNRVDRSMTGLPSDGCSSPYSGHPVYQTQWVMDDAGQTWREIGTGHQCNDTYRYWFWGYGLNGAWHSLGTQAGIMNGVIHTFQIYRTFIGSNTYYFKIDSSVKGIVASDWTGGLVRVGLESYAAGANVPAHNATALQYQKNNGTFAFWSGRDAQLVNSGMCGAWGAGDAAWNGMGQGTGC